jgi:hypothetical protein
MLLEWLSDVGASHLVIVPSGASTADGKQLVESFAAQTVRVDVEYGSVAATDFLDAVLQRLRASGSALRGVVHFAGQDVADPAPHGI